jgi:hypothetical protein
MSSDGTVRLGTLRGRLVMLEVACSRCERRGRLRLDRLLAEHGPEMPLPELRVILAGDCPHAGSVSIYDKCRVHFPQLRGLFMPRAK